MHIVSQAGRVAALLLPVVRRIADGTKKPGEE